MKKLGLIALALVVALGMAGVGYAWWTDTITINGTINTGSLVVGIKDNLVGDQYVSGGAKTVSTNNSPIGETGWYEGITETVTNAYPGYASGASVSIINLGTVPVKFGSFSFVEGSTNTFDLDHMIVGAWTLYKNNVEVESGTGLPTPADMFAALTDSDAVLESGEEARLDVAFSFDTAMDNNDMNDTASFTIVVTAVQFNQPVTLP